MVRGNLEMSLICLFHRHFVRASKVIVEMTVLAKQLDVTDIVSKASVHCTSCIDIGPCAGEILMC